MEVTLNTSVGLHQQVELAITALRSYDDMGVLRIECESGCTCVPSDIDMLTAKEGYALQVTRNVRVTQADQCRVRLENVTPEPRGLGAKLKVLEIGVQAQAQRHGTST